MKFYRKKMKSAKPDYRGLSRNGWLVYHEKYHKSSFCFRISCHFINFITLWPERIVWFETVLASYIQTFILLFLLLSTELKQEHLLREISLSCRPSVRHLSVGYFFHRTRQNTGTGGCLRHKSRKRPSLQFLPQNGTIQRHRKLTKPTADWVSPTGRRSWRFSLNRAKATAKLPRNWIFPKRQSKNISPIFLINWKSAAGNKSAKNSARTIVWAASLRRLPLPIPAFVC